MATYTVSLGVIGTLDPADYDLDRSADYPVWPDPRYRGQSEKDRRHVARGRKRAWDIHECIESH